MSIVSKIRGWLTMLLASKAKDEFNVNSITSSEMDTFIKQCGDIYQGVPYWADNDEHIRTVNFAKTICSEAARLAMLNVDINITGSTRADWIQEQIRNCLNNLRSWVEYSGGFGTVILKPNGVDIDVVTPENFKVTETRNGEIVGVVFSDQRYDGTKDKWYTRLEYHRFSDGKYIITNKCFVGDTKHENGKAIDISFTPWSGLEEEITADNVSEPLFAVLKMPAANNIDIGSPMGMPLFADAIEELRDLDIAYSRNSKEIFDSKRTVLLDSDRLMATGMKLSNVNSDKLIADKGLPDFVKTVVGTGNDDIYHEINPTLNTETRMTGINALLSQIGFKCGFSNGYFVFNEKTGMITATQVESDDRRTIQLIKDIRARIQICTNALIYALDKFADAYALAPAGSYEVKYDFDDITYSYEEDRLRWWGYVVQGKVPAWMYFTKFEGMTEDDAKAMIAEAQPSDVLFGGEE